MSRGDSLRTAEWSYKPNSSPKSGSDTLPSKKLQPHSRLYVVSPEQWKESAIALEAEVVRLEIELRDTKRALELAAKFRILAVNPNYPTDGVKQSHIDEDVALFLDKARKERTQV